MQRWRSTFDLHLFLNCQKSSLRLFDRCFAVSCVHNLSPVGGQIPHLEPEKCFLPGTRPGRKRIGFYLPPQAANSARLFCFLTPIKTAGAVYRLPQKIFQRSSSWLSLAHFATKPLRASTASRLGMTIRPLNISLISQTRDTFWKEPTAMHSSARMP